MRRNVFVDGHEWSHVMEDRKNFLQTIEKLKSYKGKFDENGAIESNICPANYVMREIHRQSIIIITHDNYTFLANDET